MKNLQLLKIAIVAGLVLMNYGPAAAWCRYDNDHYHRYGYHNRYHHHYPGDLDHDYPEYKDLYTMENGWLLIEKDRSQKALDVFKKLVKSNPGAGLPKLGYSIAAADTDKLIESVWAMRQALIYHPGALYQFKLDTRLKDKVKMLVSKYQGQSHGLPEKDASFMQASLYYLLGDKKECFQAIIRNKKDKDNSDSAKNLYYMVENYF